MNRLNKHVTMRAAILMSILAVALASVGYGLYVSRPQPAPAPPVASAPVADRLTYIGEPGQSVLDQLKREAKVETKQSTYGTLVEGINGVMNGTDGKYWLFYVDGQMADKGADAYITKGGETIEWTFSK